MTIKIRSLTFLFISIIGTLFAISLMPFSRDYSVYNNLFNEAAYANSFANSISTLELTFSTLSYLTKSLFWTSFLLGTVSLSIKLNFFGKLSSFCWIPVVYYFCRFFILHDITQIRISFGISMLILGLLQLYNKKKNAYLFFLLALITHTSTILYIPIIIFAVKTKDPRKKLKALLKFTGFFGFAFFLSYINLFNLLGLDKYFMLLPDQRLDIYYSETLNYDIPGLFTDVYLYIKIFSLIVLAFGFEKGINIKGLDDDLCYIIGIIFVFSLLFFIIFHQFYTIAARLSEIAAPFECIIMSLFIIRFSRTTITNKLNIYVLLFLVIVLCVRLFIAQLPLFYF